MSKITHELARHIREIHFGNNWTDSNIKEVLKDVTWQQAITMPIPNTNSIAVLSFHMNFYLNIVHRRIKGEVPQFDHDNSFKVPAIHSDVDWQAIMKKTWDDAETFAQTVEKLPISHLNKIVLSNQSSFYKNIQGIIEHNHYHLGQIVLLKKLL